MCSVITQGTVRYFQFSINAKTGWAGSAIFGRFVGLFRQAIYAKRNTTVLQLFTRCVMHYSPFTYIRF